jgi:hypothetical protein
MNDIRRLNFEMKMLEEQMVILWKHIKRVELKNGEVLYEGNKE